MRPAQAKTLAVGAATLSAIVAAAFLVQAAALGRPTGTQDLALQTIATLQHYHRSLARMTINETHLTSECRQQWLARGHVQTVTLSDGQKLVVSRSKLEEKGPLHVAEFELAGCPRFVSNWLTYQLNNDSLDLRPAQINDQPVYAILARSPGKALLLDISRRSLLPLKLTLTAPGLQATSEPSYGADSA